MSRAPIRGRALKALRAVALHPRGLRPSAHPSAMPALIELGYIIERRARWDGAKPGDMARFITPAGRDLLKAIGAEEIECAQSSFLGARSQPEARFSQLKALRSSL